MFDKHQDKYRSIRRFVKHEDFKPLTIHVSTFDNYWTSYRKDRHNFNLTRKKEEVPRKPRSDINGLNNILIPKMCEHIKDLVNKGQNWKDLKPEKIMKEIALKLHKQCGLKGNFKAGRSWIGDVKKIIVQKLKKDEHGDEKDDDNNLMEKEGVMTNKKNENNNDEDKDEAENDSEMNTTDGLYDDDNVQLERDEINNVSEGPTVK